MKKLYAALLECSEQQIEQIAQLWGIGNPADTDWKEYQNVLTLVERMQSPIAARFVWEHLSSDERQLLYRLLNLSSSSGILQSVLLKLSQMPEPRFDAALAPLEQYLLVLEERQRGRAGYSPHRKQSSAGDRRELLLYIPSEIAQPLLLTGRELFMPQYDRSEMTLDKLLAQLSQVELYELARLYGIRLDNYYAHYDPRSKIVGSLVQPDLAFYALEQLDAETFKLYKWLLDAGGKVSLQEVRERDGLDDESVWGTDAKLAQRILLLERCAIAFDTFSEQRRVLFVPHALLKNMKKAAAQIEVVPEERPIGLVALDEPPPVIRSADTLMVYDLAVAVGAIYQQDIEPTKSGTIPKRIAAKIQPLLHIQPRVRFLDGESLTLEMLFRLARELGLIQLSSSAVPDLKERYEPGSQLEQWSKWSIARQSSALLYSWLNSHNWVDLPGVNYTDNYSYYLDHLAARSTLLSQLDACTPGRWYSVASLLNTVKGQDPFVLRPKLYAAGMAGYRNAREVRAKWASCDGQILVGALSSSLYELGIVALGYFQSDADRSQKPSNPDGFMLTEFGARVLLLTEKQAASEAESAENKRSLVVQPNFELLLLQPDMSTLYNLLPFVQVNSIGLVSRLTLTRNSVLRGMESGRQVEQLLQLLQDRGQKEVPQNVDYTLRDWTKLYKEAKISQVFLLEVTSEALADEICMSPKLKGLGLRRLGPYAIAANGNTTPQELRRTLDKEGYVVRISGDMTARRDNRAFIYGMPR